MESEFEDAIFLDGQDVVALHAEAMGCSESDALGRVRSPASLDGAVARPLWYSTYGGDLAIQAAALAHGIAEGQPFIDGNKRTALVALRAFFFLNGWVLDASQAERAGWILRLADDLSVEQFADLLRGSMAPVS